MLWYSSLSPWTTHWVSDLAVLVVEEDVAGAVVFEVGDLQAVGVSDLLRLEGGVDAVHLDHSFGLLGLREGERQEKEKRRGKRCLCELEGSITFGFNPRLLTVDLLLQLTGV